MSQEFPPIAGAEKVIKHYREGAICPAEMWAILSSYITPDSVASILELLSAEAKSSLHAAIDDRPLSLLSTDKSFQQALAAWRNAHESD